MSQKAQWHETQVFSAIRRLLGKLTNEMQSLDKKDPRIGHKWLYHEAAARLKSRLISSLGNEGKRRLQTPIYTLTLFCAHSKTSKMRAMHYSKLLATIR